MFITWLMLSSATIYSLCRHRRRGHSYDPLYLTADRKFWWILAQRERTCKPRLIYDIYT